MNDETDRVRKECSRCGGELVCGSSAESFGCWCSKFPAIPLPVFSEGCLCYECLKSAVKKEIDAFITDYRAGKVGNIAVRYQSGSSRPVEDIDYYVERGRWVFTAWYHLKRGVCCGSGCRHCPYG